MAPMADWQSGVFSPPVQSAANVPISFAAQTPWAGAVAGVVIPAAQVPKLAGQVDCWLLHRRGTTRPLQNEPCCWQFTQLAPPPPQASLATPLAQLLSL
jgi:hypothetical protein